MFSRRSSLARSLSLSRALYFAADSCLNVNRLIHYGARRPSATNPTLLLKPSRPSATRSADTCSSHQSGGQWQYPQTTPAPEHPCTLSRARGPPAGGPDGGRRAAPRSCDVAILELRHPSAGAHRQNWPSVQMPTGPRSKVCGSRPCLARMRRQTRPKCFPRAAANSSQDVASLGRTSPVGQRGTTNICGLSRAFAAQSLQ